MARTRRSTKESSKEQTLESVPLVTIPEPMKPSPSKVSAGDMRQVLDRHANAIELAEKHTDNVLRYLLSLTLDQKTNAIMASTLPMCIDWIHCFIDMKMPDLAPFSVQDERLKRLFAQIRLTDVVMDLFSTKLMTSPTANLVRQAGLSSSPSSPQSESTWKTTLPLAKALDKFNAYLAESQTVPRHSGTESMLEQFRIQVFIEALMEIPNLDIAAALEELFPPAEGRGKARKATARRSPKIRQEHLGKRAGTHEFSRVLTELKQKAVEVLCQTYSWQDFANNFLPYLRMLVQSVLGELVEGSSSEENAVTADEMEEEDELSADDGDARTKLPQQEEDDGEYQESELSVEHQPSPVRINESTRLQEEQFVDDEVELPTAYPIISEFDQPIVLTRDFVKGIRNEMFDVLNRPHVGSNSVKKAIGAMQDAAHKLRAAVQDPLPTVILRAEKLQRKRPLPDHGPAARRRLTERDVTATRVLWDTQPDELIEPETQEERMTRPDDADRTLPLDNQRRPIPGFTPGGDDEYREEVSVNGENREQRPQSNVSNRDDDMLPILAKERRVRQPWSDYEVNLLEEGIGRFGKGQWAAILKFNGHGDGGFLPSRTSVDLKDKARNEKMRRVRVDQPLGHFKNV